MASKPNHSPSRPASASRPAKPLARSETAEAIVTMIEQIPAGCVATYGQIARLAGVPRNSRQVGAVLRALPANSGVPWFRVVNSKGEISPRGRTDNERNQREVLESEGIEFDRWGRVPLKRFGWHPDA